MEIGNLICFERRRALEFSVLSSTELKNEAAARAAVSVYVQPRRNVNKRSQNFEDFMSFNWYLFGLYFVEDFDLECLRHLKVRLDFQKLVKSKGNNLKCKQRFFSSKYQQPK